MFYLKSLVRHPYTTAWAWPKKHIRKLSHI